MEPAGNGAMPAAIPWLRSFGKRSGRTLRPSRRDCLRTILPQVALTLPTGDGLLDPRTVFAGPMATVCLEIGFGAGEHLLGLARAYPQAGLIGCEPYLPGVSGLLSRLDAGLGERVRVFPDDARLLLDRLAPASVQRIFILFPDPWPKRRHRARRLVNRALLDALARVLSPGGDWLFASDDADYASATLALATEHPGFRWTAQTAADWRTPPPEWFATRYQRKAEARGGACVYLRFGRTDHPFDVSAA